jgi:phage terminase large subunit-like protein
VITSGISAKIERYVDSVLGGEIEACDLVKRCVNRYVNDLSRAGSDEFPYYFDRKWAASACQFFPCVLKHSIGEFAGRPFELEPWQAFSIWNILGWKRCDDRSRRFRKVYWSMARKQGKSSIAAGLCLFLGAGDIDPATGKPEAIGQILLAATKKEQAAVVYGEAERMRMQSHSLKQISSVKHETITFNHNGTFIKKVSSDRPLDGMNPSVVVLDEIHAWGQHHRKFYDTIITGSAARTQPLQIIVTTAGADDSHLWLENYDYACNVLRGIYKDESLFAIIYELDEGDDPGDESKWIKANPNLNISCSLDYLRQRWNEDKHTSIGRNRFMRYHMNRVVSSTERPFDISDFDACVKPLSDWSKSDAIGSGTDLGSRDDLAAYGLVARFPIDVQEDGTPIYRYEGKVRSFIAQDSRRDLTKSPFSQWIHNGSLKVSKYPIADLQDSLIEECLELGIQRSAYDPYNGQQLCENLTREGIVAVRMAQNPSMFNEPIRDFIQAIKDGRFTFEDSGLLRWAASNAIIVRDNSDRWMFDKKTSTEQKANSKIDPIVALVMAFNVCCREPHAPVGSLLIT